MIKSLCLFLFFICAGVTSSFSQTYTQKILAHRQTYKEEFLSDENSPLRKEDTSYLQFYAPNPGYVVHANFTRVVDTIGFAMQTHSGKIKTYFVYGYVTFSLGKKMHKLFIYQSKSLQSKSGFEDYLFLPFTDKTNYRTTFGGGRYIDFKIKDIQDNKLVLDFNTCYNPYCAYKEGYSCPIPPAENKLNIAIKAGEKVFGKAVMEK